MSGQQHYQQPAVEQTPPSLLNQSALVTAGKQLAAVPERSHSQERGRGRLAEVAAHTKSASFASTRGLALRENELRRSQTKRKT